MKNDRFLLDTNILISHFNNLLKDDFPDGELLCSVITEMELLSYPHLSTNEEAKIRECLKNLTICPINKLVKEETIRLRRSKRLKLPDAIIVATAMIHNAVLVTNDKELHKIQNLNSVELITK